MTTIPSIEVTDFHTDIYACGSGYGECVVVNIGGGLVIALDSNRLIAQPEADGGEKILKHMFPQEKFGASASLVWILTHYHYDHFIKLPGILKKYRESLDALVIPHDIEEADLAELQANAQRMRASEMVARELKTDCSRLRSFFGSVDGELRRGVRRVDPDYVYRWNLKKEGGEERELSLGIYGRSVPWRDSAAGKSMQRKEKATDHVRRRRQLANAGAYISYLRLGDRCAAFFADAPTDQISNSIEWATEESLLIKGGLEYVKISHHGSKTGTDEELLKKLLKFAPAGRNITAAITPFENKNLPEAEIVDLLERHDFDVFVSNQSAAAHDTEPVAEDPSFYLGDDAREVFKKRRNLANSIYKYVLKF